MQPKKLEEGMQVKHCALSLVGEPIMYPEINTLIKLLHSKGISSFLVTNAQFPDAIQKLEPVTQLYVSVDASNEQSLKKIDRPLFRDFWQRFLDSLKALDEKVSSEPSIFLAFFISKIILTRSDCLLNCNKFD